MEIRIVRKWCVEEDCGGEKRGERRKRDHGDAPNRGLANSVYGLHGAEIRVEDFFR